MHMTGVDNVDQRYYASSYGRFNTVDPFGGSVRPNSPSSWNRYAYCHDDPLNCSDPSGLIDWVLVGEGGLQIGAGILGIGGAVAVAAGSLGGGLPVTVILSIGSAGAITSGFGSLITGFTTSGSQVPPSTTSSLYNFQQVGTAGGLLGGVLSGGNQTAIQLGAAASNSVSTFSDLNSFNQRE